jgi:hypothetical protein
MLPPRRVAAIAVGAGVVGLVALIVVLGVFFFGDRPEEAAAASYLTAVYDGDAAGAYDMTTPAYRALVTPANHQLLVDTLHATAGNGVVTRTIGAERTPGTDPIETLVGYKGTTAIGAVEGVVTLFRIEDEWLVAAVSYRFPDAPPGATDELDAVTRALNEQLSDGASAQSG